MISNLKLYCLKFKILMKNKMIKQKKNGSKLKSIQDI